MALGVLLTYQHEERALDARGVADVEQEFAADAVAAPLPKVFPDGWQRAPCPRDANVRTVKGHCFIATGARPPCAYGYDDTESGECLVALNAPKREPTSVRR